MEITAAGTVTDFHRIPFWPGHARNAGTKSTAKIRHIFQKQALPYKQFYNLADFFVLL